MRSAILFEGELFRVWSGDPAATGLVLLLGGMMLLMGRRLFWLAVALLGFLGAIVLMEALVGELRRPWIWILALVAGLLGSVLAVAVQRLAVVVGGFLLGVVGCMHLLAWTGNPGGRGVEVLILLAGGLLVALVASSLFALALRLITAGAGSALIVFTLRPTPPFDLLLFGGLWLTGFVLQRGRGSQEHGLPRRR
ncbi:MAG: DUF4203 domain-containing protein [Thermoanaerobaculia bacterium]|nr:DUF4203 domain-containing protein [Thermoanaerobaculia bacterium]